MVLGELEGAKHDMAIISERNLMPIYNNIN